MSEGSLQIVRRLIESFQEGLRQADFTYDQALVAPDLEWILEENAALGVSDVSRGAEEFSEFMRTLTEDFDEWSLELEELRDVGDDRVLAVVRQKAVGKASGAPVELHQAQIYELKEERVIRTRNYLGPSQAFKAAGLPG